MNENTEHHLQTISKKKKTNKRKRNPETLHLEVDGASASKGWKNTREHILEKLDLGYFN